MRLLYTLKLNGTEQNYVYTLYLFGEHQVQRIGTLLQIDGHLVW